MPFGSYPVMPSMTRYPANPKVSDIDSMVSLNRDVAMLGTSTATRRLRLEASPPARRFGT